MKRRRNHIRTYVKKSGWLWVFVFVPADVYHSPTQLPDAFLVCIQPVPDRCVFYTVYRVHVPLVLAHPLNQHVGHRGAAEKGPALELLVVLITHVQCAQLSCFSIFTVPAEQRYTCDKHRDLCRPLQR